MFTVIIASFMVPVFANMVPLFTIISDLGLVNNPLAVIMPFSATPIGVFLFVQFFRDLPDSVRAERDEPDEAASREPVAGRL